MLTTRMNITKWCHRVKYPFPRANYSANVELDTLFDSNLKEINRICDKYKGVGRLKLIGGFLFILSLLYSFSN